jgi:hypothetical protein
MKLDANEIKLNELDLGGYGIAVIDLVIKPSLERDQEITDIMYSWIINPPPIYASAEKNLAKRQKEDHDRYLAKQEESLSFTRLVKKEFYDFMCTHSKYYQKERTAIGGNINMLITGVAAAIATKLANVEVGVITSFVTSFIIVVAKVGKKSMCEYCKPKKE